MERDMLLKKNIIGGFDRKQVLEYVNRLQSSCDSRKTREEIAETRLRIEALREAIRNKDKEISALNHEIDTISNIELPKDNGSQFDILKRSDMSIDEAREKAEEITEQISEGIKSKDEKIVALFTKLFAINEEISKLSSNLSTISEKMDEVPFEPVTEKDVDVSIVPKFDFDKVVDEIEREQAELQSKSAVQTVQEAPQAAEETAEEEPESIVSSPSEQESESFIEYFSLFDEQLLNTSPAETSETAEEEPAEPEAIEKSEEIPPQNTEKPEEKTVVVNEDKFNALFAKLTAMTEEINKMHGSISDVSEKLDRMPEPVSEAEEVKETSALKDDEPKAEADAEAEQKEITPVQEEKEEIKYSEEQIIQQPVAEEPIPEELVIDEPEITEEPVMEELFAENPIKEDNDPILEGLSFDEIEPEIQSHYEKFSEPEEVYTEPSDEEIMNLFAEIFDAPESGENQDSIIKKAVEKTKARISKVSSKAAAVIEKDAPSETPEQITETENIRNAEAAAEAEPAAETEPVSDAVSKPTISKSVSAVKPTSEQTSKPVSSPDKKPVTDSKKADGSDGSDFEEELYFTLEF